ncbi:hypothetical protein [Nannocystis punicea]|uniref:Uncharacterized protein n=1 Tax=Nannocystis punicea TaxID=2995304 RepID=A0ABY7H9M9_9BACT|nr:hypothetical protein [Nannocystis poenicansa]WAS95807.1 hypothetical protein O0S08_06555 [Nannocystis poenicansa]
MTRRSPTTRAEAGRLIEALVERRFDGPLPPLSTAVLIVEWTSHLCGLALAETLPLQGRALFASGSLEPRAREHAAWHREAFFHELGAPFGLSARAVLAAVRARKFPLVPPRPIGGYEYLGAFRCSGVLDVADPCHLRKASRMPASIFALSSTVEALAGPWQVFVRAGVGEDADCTAELAVIHADGVDVVAAEQIGTIGVDAGMAGVFDRTCPEPAQTELHVEGVVHGLGAFAFSGHGDGLYPVFVGKALGRVAKLRIVFIAEHPERDATVPPRASRRYASSEVFAVGDVVDHPKFGAGSVIRVVDGKIEVEFDDEVRTLIHGRR